MAGKYADVIRKSRAERGLNQQELAERLGVSRNTVAGWETGHSRPDLDLVPEICKALRIPLSQFFQVRSGLTLPEKRLLDTFRDMEEGDREIIQWQMEALCSKRREQRRTESIPELIAVYASDLGAAAGFGAPLDNARGEKILLRKDAVTERADEVIRVSGHSMEPLFSDGDRVLVRHMSELQPGEIGVFLVDGEGFIKEYQRDGLHSRNPAYGTMHFTDDHDVRCIGRVLGRLEADQIPTEEEIKKAAEARRGRTGAII